MWLTLFSSLAQANTHHIVFMVDLSGSMKTFYQDEAKMAEIRASATELIEEFQEDPTTKYSFYTFGQLRANDSKPDVVPVLVDISASEALNELQKEDSLLSSSRLLPITNQPWTYVASSVRSVLNEFHFSTDPCHPSDDLITLMTITDKGADGGGESTPMIDLASKLDYQFDLTAESNWNNIQQRLQRSDNKREQEIGTALKQICGKKNYAIDCDFAAENAENIRWLNQDAMNLEHLIYRHWNLEESTSIQDTELWYRVEFSADKIAIGTPINPALPETKLETSFDGEQFPASVILTPLPFAPNQTWVEEWKKQKILCANQDARELQSSPASTQKISLFAKIKTKDNQTQIVNKNFGGLSLQFPERTIGEHLSMNPIELAFQGKTNILFNDPSIPNLRNNIQAIDISITENSLCQSLTLAYPKSNFIFGNIATDQCNKNVVSKDNSQHIPDIATINLTDYVPPPDAQEYKFILKNPQGRMDAPLSMHADRWWVYRVENPESPEKTYPVSARFWKIVQEKSYQGKQMEKGEFVAQFEYSVTDPETGKVLADHSELVHKKETTNGEYQLQFPQKPGQWWKLFSPFGVDFSMAKKYGGKKLDVSVCTQIQIANPDPKKGEIIVYLENGDSKEITKNAPICQSFPVLIAERPMLNWLRIFWLVLGSIFSAWTAYSWFFRSRIPSGIVVGSNKINLKKEYYSADGFQSFLSTWLHKEPPVFFLELSPGKAATASPFTTIAPTSGSSYYLGFQIRNDRSLWMWVQHLPEKDNYMLIEANFSQQNLHPFREVTIPNNRFKKKFNKKYDNGKIFYILKKKKNTEIILWEIQSNNPSERNKSWKIFFE